MVGVAGCSSPDPTTARDVEDFVALLRLLKVWAGDPSFEELRRRTRVPSSTLADALHATRTRLPRLEVVRRFVRACGGTADDLARWEAAWRALQARQRGSVAVQQSFPATPRQLPRDVPDFVGRQAMLDRLDRVHSEHSGRGRGSPLALIVGPAGVGKSALALHWAHRMVDAYPDGQLYIDLRRRSAEPAVPARDALPLLLRAIGVPDGDIPADAVARASLFRSLTYPRRLLIVLDNAHDAEQVRPLLPGGPVCLTLVTSRSRLSGLVAREGGTRLALAPLRSEEAEQLIDLTLEDEGATWRAEPIRQLARLCGYVPLALRIAVAYLADRGLEPASGHVAQLADDDRLADVLMTGEAAAAVRSALDGSYTSLEAPTRRVFRQLAAARPRFTARDAVTLTGLPDAEVRHRLDALVAIHLVEPAGHDTYAMNNLVRLYAVQLARDPAPPGAHALHRRRTPRSAAAGGARGSRAAARGRG